ncbi:hypothetical protein WN944_001588 [Citrus x changshan-huyou]|uniref:Uncharacterized protein n=1 Tax=Citrus x changshan-huyou TaxID=2935761 RepID=A0AAP0MHF4_9ROSI
MAQPNHYVYAFSSHFSLLLNLDVSLISYADHCNSTVHESNLNKFEPSMSSFAVLHTGHYTGGNEIQSHNPSETSHSLTLRTLNVYRTDKSGEFAIEGSLLLRSRNFYYCEGDVA